MKIRTPQCLYCGKAGELEVPDRGYVLYNMGVKIQDAFPTLSVDEREQLISGTHVGECSHKFDEEYDYESDWDNNGN